MIYFYYFCVFTHDYRMAILTVFTTHFLTFLRWTAITCNNFISKWTACTTANQWLLSILHWIQTHYRHRLPLYPQAITQLSFMQIMVLIQMAADQLTICQKSLRPNRTHNQRKKMIQTKIKPTTAWWTFIMASVLILLFPLIHWIHSFQSAIRFSL